jgi:hypothetical protein
MPWVLGLALWAPTALAAESEAEAPAGEAPVATVAEGPDAGAGRWSLFVSALEEYRLRTYSAPTLSGPTGAPPDILEPAALAGESDHDVRVHLAAGVADPSDHFAADLSLGLWLDADGGVPQGDPSGFGSMYDATDPPLWFDIYTLSAEYRSRGVLGHARGGRQVSDWGQPVAFDGASVHLRAVKHVLEFGLFGGRTAHFFETGAATFEDWIGSAVVIIRPLHDLELELDYRFQLEDTLLTEGLEEHGYGLAVKYRHDRWLYLKAHVHGLDDRISQVGLDASFIWSELELGVNARLTAQPTELDELTESEDPYFSILGSSLPHLKARLDVWKSFTTDFGVYSLHAGWDGRVLLGEEPTRFNRDYGRAYLLLHAADIGIKGPFASFSTSYHYTHKAVDTTADDLVTVGGSAGWATELWQAEVGTDYQRFKIDYFRDAREVEDVRTVFAQVKVRPIKWFGARVRYAYEKADRDLHQVTLTLTQTY